MCVPRERHPLEAAQSTQRVARGEGIKFYCPSPDQCASRRRVYSVACVGWQVLVFQPKDASFGWLTRKELGLEAVPARTIASCSCS